MIQQGLLTTAQEIVGCSGQMETPLPPRTRAGLIQSEPLTPSFSLKNQYQVLGTFQVQQHIFVGGSMVWPSFSPLGSHFSPSTQI